MTLQTVEADLAAATAAIESDGAVIVRDLVAPDAVKQLNADLDEAIEATAPGSRSGIRKWEDFHGANTIRFCGLAARSRTFVTEVLLNPLLLAWADGALLPHCTDYWLNTSQMMIVGPGEPAQRLHRDEGNWPEALSEDKELTVSCLLALTPFTEEVGATRVVPGSHNKAHTEETAAVMEPGSGLLYSGKVVHGAGENRTSDQWRRGLHCSYVLGWLRPEEASPIAVSQSVAAELPERARRLLGWASYHSDGGGRTWLVDFEETARSRSH